MLVDTDILIDYLRGQVEAIELLEGHVEHLHASAVTVAELFQGVKEGTERTKLATTLSAITILPLTEEIAEQAGLFRSQYKASMECGLADCMIAATASKHGLDLVTLNSKHFAMLDSVIVPYKKG